MKHWYKKSSNSPVSNQIARFNLYIMKQSFLICLIAGLACITSNPLAGQSGNLQFVEYDLPNGLHVILHEDHSTPIVAVSVMYHVGSKNENPNRTGFAHFFEHLLFEGSDNIGRGEYAKYVESAGGVLNANTSNDRTYYYEVLPSNQLALGLWLESERMMHAKVEETGIETQREVVKEERRQNVDNQPYGTFLQEIMAHAFTVHPYRWPVIGSMEHLNAAQENDYVQFYKSFYVPNNAVLSIAGDIDPQEAKQLIEKYFAPIEHSAKPVYRPHVTEPPLKGPVKDTVYDNIQLPAVIQGYRIPAQGTPDYYAISMLGQLLSQGQSSRLYKALVDEQRKAVFVGSIPLPLEDPGIFITYGISNLNVPTDAVSEAIDVEIKKVQDNLISEQEFQKLRNQVEKDFISSNTTMAQIAESLANYHLYFGDTNLINTQLEKYLDVTREDIRRVARQYFVPTNRVEMIYLPKTVKP